jgi:hypothetical protein
MRVCFGCATLILVSALFLGLPLIAQDQSPDQSKDTGTKNHNSIGFVASDEAGPEEVGLPAYPGSKPYHEKDDDSTSANLGLWGGAFGFKLAVMKLESADSPEKVAAFYHKALSRYGSVLDCTHSTPGESKKSSSSQELTCEDDKPESGGMLFKSGTKSNLHAVGIEPFGKGTRVQLVYMMAHGSDSK